MQFIGVRHEPGAALMADGFSRISGAPSVCLATNGPGVLNLTYGIGSAYVAHSPVVILAPSASRERQYRDSTQEFDQVALFKPIAKASFPINKIERLPDALRQAFRVATSGKMGPVMVDIPRDLLPGPEIELDLVAPESYRSGQTRARGDRTLVNQAARALLLAQRPVIVAGSGIQWSDAGEEVTRLADLIGAAVVPVIMNNNSWDSEKAYQRYAFDERYGGADTNNPRYDRYAEQFGGHGFYVERPENIGDDLLTALHANGPSIIEIPTDPDQMSRPARLAEAQSPQSRS